MSAPDPMCEWLTTLLTSDDETERRLAASNIAAHVTRLRLHLKETHERAERLEKAPRWTVYAGGRDGT